MTEPKIATGLSIPREIQAEQSVWPTRAAELVVQSDEQYRGAGEMLLGIKALRRRIREFTDGNIRRWHEGHRAAIAERDEIDSPLEASEALVSGKMTEYDRIRKENEAAELLAKLALARRQNDERVINEAAALELEAKQTGDESLLAHAEALLSQPQPIVVVQQPTASPKIKGLAVTETWEVEVTSMMALLRFVLANPQHLRAVQANETYLKAEARNKRQLFAIDGVRAWVTKGLKSTGR